MTIVEMDLAFIPEKVCLLAGRMVLLSEKNGISMLKLDTYEIIKIYERKPVSIIGSLISGNPIP